MTWVVYRDQITHFLIRLAQPRSFEYNNVGSSNSSYEAVQESTTKFLIVADRQGLRVSDTQDVMAEGTVGADLHCSFSSDNQVVFKKKTVSGSNIFKVLC